MAIRHLLGGMILQVGTLSKSIFEKSDHNELHHDLLPGSPIPPSPGVGLPILRPRALRRGIRLQDQPPQVLELDDVIGFWEKNRWLFSKNKGKTPKMEGENSGKPY